MATAQAAYFAQRALNEKLETDLKLVAMSNSNKQEKLTGLQSQIAFVKQQIHEETNTETLELFKKALKELTTRYLELINLN